MCGALVEAFGWESAWYVIGGITTVWTVCWAFLVYDTPDKHPWISDSEKEYIKVEKFFPLPESYIICDLI